MKHGRLLVAESPPRDGDIDTNSLEDEGILEFCVGGECFED